MYLDRANDEFNYAFHRDVPSSEDFNDIDIQQVVRKLVSRMLAIVFLGSPACRNEQWLNLSVQFAIDTFQTSFTLRLFPPIMHPIVAFLLPSRYRIQRDLQLAEKITTPMVEKHFREKQLPPQKQTKEKEDTLLNWMLDKGTAEETQPDKLASRQLILTLASIHTTSMAVSNALYDLCAHPEFFKPLREEIEEVLQRRSPDQLSESHLGHLQKLDSFLMESQRFNPPILLSPQRMAMQPLTLRDGTHLPLGTRVAFPSHDILNDEAVTPNPHTFDPYRSYRKRQNSTERNNHTFGKTDELHLNFGHGKQACPGRMFAVAEIKIILARFILEFDFQYPPGKKRPANMYLDENVFPNPSAKLMIRKRVSV